MPSSQQENQDDWASTEGAETAADGQKLDLLPGERIDFTAPSTSTLQGYAEKENVVRRGQTDFRIVTEQARYQVAQIPDLVGSAEWNLNPDFQRRHRWDIPKRSRLIESIMLNVPIPPIFLYEAELSQFEVMDGLQRLTAISEFYKDSYELQDLEYFPDLNGKSFSSIDDVTRRIIGRRYLSAVILLHETGKTPEEADLLKQLVFERINSGGVDLTPQESRNALLPGRMNRLCLDLAETPSFRRLWGMTAPEGTADGDDDPISAHPFYRSMYDVELVLRFFAYRQRLAGGVGPRRNLRGYLDSYLGAANRYSEELIEELRLLFIRTADLVEQVLGEQAFWLYRHRKGAWQWIEEPAVVAYEPLMLAFSQRLSAAEALTEKSAEIQADLPRFYQENGDRIDGRKVNSRDLAERNRLYLGFLDSHLA
ncbi:DUF262 domain-containing protein [Streptomyces sp. AN-3]|uniref:DUF262 domain-containing protein n=1 Tax=Streptomyces sp. AN-3 TaxID=3044177 RepID=UPI00249C9422|nr:DUF262 domain-containing protein [Streptomyces sp. AN-3]MDI3100499.1 DUF262 domain-containing protein [Streptomyces sp. AN-3]